MPPAVNPNPDRARRGASVVSKDEAKDEFVPEPLLPVGAPAAAARAPIWLRSGGRLPRGQQTQPDSSLGSLHVVVAVACS